MNLMASKELPYPEPARSAESKSAPPRLKRKCVLADLLKGMTPEAMHDAFDWGPDRGREVVE
jgi:antitoxin component of MazEF toxin-antitoxin module